MQAFSTFHHKSVALEAIPLSVTPALSFGQQQIYALRFKEILINGSKWYVNHRNSRCWGNFFVWSRIRGSAPPKYGGRLLQSGSFVVKSRFGANESIKPLRNVD